MVKGKNLIANFSLMRTQREGDGGERGGGDGGEAGQRCAGDWRMNTETNWKSAANVVVQKDV